VHNPYIFDTQPKSYPLSEGLAPVPFIDVTQMPVEGPPPRSSLPGGLKLPELNLDTLILLALVWFLVGEETGGETLLIVAVLLVLGF